MGSTTGIQPPRTRVKSSRLGINEDLVGVPGFSQLFLHDIVQRDEVAMALAVYEGQEDQVQVCPLLFAVHTLLCAQWR